MRLVHGSLAALVQPSDAALANVEADIWLVGNAMDVAQTLLHDELRGSAAIVAVHMERR